MMAIKLMIPSICEKIYGYIFEATIFDVFPLEIPYDWITGVAIVVGYDSVTAIRNIGSLFLVVTWAYLVIMVLKCCRFCCKGDPYAPCKKIYK
jgi:hypothetical protein